MGACLSRSDLDALRPNLVAGTTLMLVDAPILPDTTGQSRTLITNQPPQA
jgi:hypothetical protein